MPSRDLTLFGTNENALRGFLVKETNIEEGFSKNPPTYDTARFLSFGLFKFMPDGWMRRYIYGSGGWFFRGKDTNSVINTLAEIYSFAHIHNAQSKKPTFKLFHTSYTHMPYATYADKNGQCHFLNTQSIWTNPERFALKNAGSRFYYHQHFDTEACALFLLNDYFEWMKKENIYDNTQIFIVSDHGGDDSLSEIPRESYRQGILFLFKDFDSRGEIKIDSRLMINSDIASIFCSNLKNGCPNVAPNILKNYPENREVIQALPTWWDKTEWGEVERALQIKGSIYNADNYTDIIGEYAIEGKFAKK